MDEAGDYYVNEADGLSNDHPAMPEYVHDENSTAEANADSFDDLPKSIIVTNISSNVFVNDELKAEMESLFRRFSDDVTFQWLKSFRRLRVNYSDAISAGEYLAIFRETSFLSPIMLSANARIQLHQYKFHDSIINCYFAQPVTPVSNKNLQPPAPTKQYLISHPAVHPRAGNKRRNASRS